MKLLGNRYQHDYIRQRIIDNEKTSFDYYCTRDKSFQIKPFYEKYKRKELTGFQRYYIHWQYVLGILPYKKHTRKKLSKEVREELRKIDRISYETVLLCKHNITNIDELNAFRNEIQKEYDEYFRLRKYCYNERLKVKDEDKRNELSEKAKSYTPKIKELRYTLKCLDEIEERSLRFQMQSQELENNKIKTKERER